MENKRNGQTIAIVVLSIAILLMSVGFAGFVRNLTINGSANIKASSWDVSFVDTSYAESAGSVAATSKSIDATSMTYDVTLSKPGDFYEFTINVANKGDFDANLDSITLSSLTEAQKKYISYKVTYGSTEYTNPTNPINGVTLVKQTGVETVKVRVEYIIPENESELPSTDVTNLSLNATLSYSQA